MNEEAFVKKTKNPFSRLIPIGFLMAWLPLLPGCLLGPNFHSPQPTAPAGWAGFSEVTADQPALVTSQAAAVGQWWAQFNDPTLNRLVEEAVAANLDLKIAETRLRQARATRGIVAGGLWPSVIASAGYQRWSKPGVTAGDQDLYQAGFDALWELDFFGGQRRSLESAEANIQAATENIRDVQVSLISEVALNYIQLRGYQQEIVIARKNLKAQQQTVEIIRKQFKAGFSSGLDLANAEVNAAVTESQIPVFETAARQSIYTLSVLLAGPPGDLIDLLSPEGLIPRVPSVIPAGFPSDLLRRRPDIRASEAQLHAATAQIGVAIAAFFPQFSLTGSINWQSNMVSSWWTPGSSFTIGPVGTWSIFQGGATASNVRLQEALRDQAFLAYQKKVLGAFQDVENALIAFNKEQQHRKVLQEAVSANRKAVNLALLLYSEGMTDFLNVLITQRSLYSTEDALVQSERAVVTNLIALYKALGGGWE
jgi:multidrug efflux system outer membrane protein